MTKNQKRKLSDILIAAVTLLLSVAALFQLGNIRIDSSAEVFIPEDNNVRLINEEIKEEFGSPDNLIMGLESKYSSVLESEILMIIQDITNRLEDTPSVEQVISLTNMEYIQASTEGMEVLPLLEGEGRDALEKFRRRLNDWREIYYGTVISPDHTFAAVIVQPDKSSDDAEQAAIYESMLELAEEYSDENIHFTFAGQPVLKNEISRSIFRDLMILIPLAAFLIILVLAVSFRKLEGVLFPLVSLAVSCIWVVGLIGVLGITFTMATLLVPVLLLVVGSAYGIHIMTHFYEEVGEKDVWINYEELTLILDKVSGRIRLSVILAGVTTAAGFLSQLFSPLAPFKVFGALCAAGIFFALLLTFILIPALIRLRYPRGLDPLKIKKGSRPHHQKERPRSGWIHFFYRMVNKGRIPVLILTVLMFGTTFILLPKINVGTNLIEFFSSESKMVQDTNTFNEKLDGTGTISLVIDAPERGDVLQPWFLKQLEYFGQWLPDEAHQVTSVQSVVPGIRRMNMIMNADRQPYESLDNDEPEIDFFSDGGLWESESTADEGLSGVFSNESTPAYGDSSVPAGGTAFNEIPSEPAKYGMTSDEELHDLLTQYMILYSGSLEMMLNDSLEPDQILVTVRLNSETSRDLKEVTRSIENYWDYYMRDGWTYKIAGNSIFNVVLMDLVANSQMISLSLSLVIVFIIMLFLFRSIKAGLAGMIPVVFALAGIFAFMVLLGYSLDIITSLLAALAVGVGVDYAIHFMTAYRRELSSGNPEPLVSVYRTTGRAILFNAASVALGFLCLLGSQFIPIRRMGLLFAVAMVFAAFSSLIVLPIALKYLKNPFGTFEENTLKETIEWEETTKILTGNYL